MAKIEYRDTIWFLTIPGREVPMTFFTESGARSFAVNNLGLKVA